MLEARPRCRFAFALLVSTGLFFATVTGPTAAQEPVAAVQTTLYFGLKSADGSVVSEKQWARFLAEVVTPRFPQGLTVVTAYGQGANPGADVVLAELTKVLIVVHPGDKTSTAKVSEIKAQYSKDFGSTGVFHTESDVRVVP
jgi:hypothetical protein